ncbi:hypothetical protein MM213_01925 [Belliella sp. R4-6]|uniref:Uncharacterized protein n=1 Tax=Belliella alkalica TaxID=1730871 RepID=A0ABS9V733_9BACT|nr:hypothetical protein [Belliella alkalica]MCH7412226.1 hypothetical protein [Belliella alkalica]
MNLKSILLLSSIFLLTIIEIQAQQDDIFGIDTRVKRGRMSESNIGNVFRKGISNFSFELSSGGSYLHNNMDFLSANPSEYPISQFQNIENTTEIPVDEITKFDGSGFGVPINLGVKLNVFNLFILGGGYGREIGNINNLQGSDYRFEFQNSSYTFDKLYGNLGLVLYDAKKRASFLKWKYRRYSSQNIYMQSEKNQRIRQNYPWRFILEGEYGSLIVRKSPDSRLVNNNEPYYGIAFRIERQFSEYARFFVKTGAEFRNLSFEGTNIEEFQNIKQTLYGAQVGLSISLPGTKRCKVQGCGVVMKHLHDGVEYRGSSIFNLQNRRVGQWY